MKIHFKGFFPCDPPTATSQQKICFKGRYFPTKDLATAKKFWERLSKAVLDYTGSRISDMGKPLFFHVAFVKPLLKKHKKRKMRDLFWHTNKPDGDNWVKLVQDCMASAGVIAPDSWVARLVVEKFFGEVPGVRFTIGTLDDDDIPETEELMCKPELTP